MEFYTPSKLKRPVRLSEKTREFAYESLLGKYGRDTLAAPAVSVDDVPDIKNATDIEKYDAAIRKIALTAPIRICENELISGAATLGDATIARIPARLNGDMLFFGVNHLTVDFFGIVKHGYDSLFKKAARAYEKYKGTPKEAFAKSVLSTLESFEIYHKRYINALSGMPDKKENYKNLLRVPKRGARNFYEAVQSLWFTFAFVRLCGNWPGIGRIDVLLGDYLKRDLENGTIDLDRAREITAHFFIKGCEWISGEKCVSGDAQFYQNIVLSGTNEKGEDVTNEVTYLVLDVIEELGISEFPTSVRLNSKSSERLIDKVAKTVRHGGGTIAVYNEDLIINSLVDYGYKRAEAVNFANDGCWEIQIPGKTHFGYVPFDGLAVLQKITFDGYNNSDFNNIEDIYAAYIRDLKDQIELIYSNITKALNPDGKTFKPERPCTLVSIFEHDCIKRGLSYFEGGTVYYVISPHFGGFADVVNSLYAIKKLVFDDKKLSLREFFQVLKSNWQDSEPLRLYAANKYSYYGNDNKECDEIAARLIDDFALLCRNLDGRCPIKFPAGISTFGRQIEWSKTRLSAPHGKKAHDVLANNASPTPSTATESTTAVIKSYACLPLKKLVNGSALEVRIPPELASQNNGVYTVNRLIRGFIELGGQFLQIDVTDKNALLAAQCEPEKYKELSVRVSGWNARFVTLDKEWQDMIIKRL